MSIMLHRIGILEQAAGGGGGDSGALTTKTTVADSRISIGDQDITISGFGTPTGAIFIYTKDGDETDTTVVDGLAGSFGAVDGTNERVVGFASQNGVSTSSTKRRATADSVILELDPSDGSVAAEAAFVSFITDGVRINWSAVTGNAVKFTVVLLRGDDISLHVGSTALATQGNAVTITPGFEMKAGIFFSKHTVFNDTAEDNAFFINGFASYDGATIRQAVGFFRDINNSVLANPQAGVRDDAVYAIASDATKNAEVTSVTSTQVEITSNNNDFSTNEIGYILIGGLDNAWAGVVDTPATTGINSWTDPGFMPKAAFLYTTRLSSLDTFDQTFLAGSVGLSVITADNQFHASWYSEDATGVMDTASQLVDQACRLLNDGNSSPRIVAVFDSFTANGLDLNFTGTDPSNGDQKKWPALFLR